MKAIPCSIIRGGTSKGIFVLEEHLPHDPGKRDQLLLALMGSPDPRQIDGLGGADPLTSKVAIVAPSKRPGIDVEYESVEVGIAETAVGHGIMCGNLIAGVGCFAIAEGLIAPQAPATTATIYCRSNQKTIIAQIPLALGADTIQAMSASSDETAPVVDLVFHNPGGAVTGKLLPTGEPVTRLSLGKKRELKVSIVDAGTLYSFVRAESFGLSGMETAEELDGNAQFRAEIEAVREKVAECVNHYRFGGAPLISPRLVKLAIVSRYAASDSLHGDADIVARIINKAKVHKAYAVSGAISLAAAAAIPGTLVNDIIAPAASPFTLRVAHPSGVLAVRMQWFSGVNGVVIENASIQRSARIIMRGTAYVGSRERVAKPIVVQAEVAAVAGAVTS